MFWFFTAVAGRTVSEAKKLMVFKRHMSERFMWAVKPRIGDFFLTASRTDLNKRIRSWSGSKYGHGIIYLGPMQAEIKKLPNGQTLYFPARTEKHCAFELPIKCTGLHKILENDECFRICHVSPTRPMTGLEVWKIKTFCRSFSMAKIKGGTNIGGYSDRMALHYAATDSFAGLFQNRFIPKEHIPAAMIPRLSAKVLNALVQEIVEMEDGYPNLNCTSLIAWIYKKLDRKITFFSATTSPDDIYQAVSNSPHFKVREFTFARFDKPAARLPKPVTAAQASNSGMQGNIPLVPEF